MSAPRCTVCDDTGEVGQLGSLDCTACNAAETRMRLNAHMAFALHMPVADRDWAVFQYAQSLASDAVRDVDVPEAVTKESDDSEWLDQFSHVGGAVAFHLIERHGKDWSDCGRLMEVFAKARSAAPIAAKPSEAVSAAPAGEVIAWRVTGDYTDTSFKDESSADAYLRGLLQGDPDGGYKKMPTISAITSTKEPK